MKAFYRPQRPTTKQQKQIRQRIQNDVDAYVDTRAQTLTDKICGMACLVLSSEFGFGEKRMIRFLRGINEAAKMYIQDNEDDVGDELLFVRLERIGLGDLVTQIKEDKSAEKESIKDTIFDLGGSEE